MTSDLFGNGIDTFVHFEPLLGLRVVLCKLFGHIGTDIAILLLNVLGSVQRLLRRDPRLSLSQELLDEVCDVPAGYWDVFNTAAYNVTLCLWTEEKRTMIFIPLSIRLCLLWINKKLQGSPPAHKQKKMHNDFHTTAYYKLTVLIMNQ